MTAHVQDYMKALWLAEWLLDHNIQGAVSRDRITQDAGGIFRSSMGVKVRNKGRESLRKSAQFLEQRGLVERVGPMIRVIDFDRLDAWATECRKRVMNR